MINEEKCMDKTFLNPDSGYCPICGASNLIHFQADASDFEGVSVNITECKSCTFAWQYPAARTEQQSSEWFEDAYRDSGQTGSEYFSLNRKQKIAELEFGFVLQLPTNETNRILDVGAGSGIFAKVAADNGWNVTAVDPSLEVDQISIDSIKRFKGGIEKISGNEYFDVITMWDVIEHTERPLDMIREAISHLDESGWLVIETGNYKSVARILGGKSHWIYQLDHRWYFSPESITKILKSMGFSEFIYVNRSLRPNWSGEMGYAGPSISQLVKSIIRQPFELRQHMSVYKQLKGMKTSQMPGIEIFTMAARKS